MKIFLPALILVLLTVLLSSAMADALPIEGPAPYPPVLSALSEDGLSYDDGTLSVRIEPDEAFGTKVYYVFVQLTDPTQLRTALAAPHPSKKQALASIMAEENNAVLAVNGDFFNYHGDGVVWREGKMLRNKVRRTRDTCIIDEHGDMRLIAPTTLQALDSFEGQIIDAFCFGPALIIDGEIQVFNYREKTSCGYPTKAQRMIFCQLGPLNYMFLATEGPEQDQPGLTIPEAMTLLEKYDIKQAYNMDGGNSTIILLCGNKINAVGAKTRTIGDIIYFATLVH